MWEWEFRLWGGGWKLWVGRELFVLHFRGKKVIKVSIAEAFTDAHGPY